jgi:hypothetical protein
MNLPVRYFEFQKDAFVNDQLNRGYSLGFTRQEKIAHVGAVTGRFGDYVEQFIRLAEEAVAQDRLMDGVFYSEAAELLAAPEAKNKLRLYDQFRDLFYTAFAEDYIERHEISYAAGSLPAMRLGSVNSEKGVYYNRE